MEIQELTNLKCLNLSENQFSIFPMEIFLLESLERLYLGQNKGIKFTSLPGDIIKLQVGATEGGRSFAAVAWHFCGLQLLPNAGLKVLLISLGTWYSIRPGLLK